MKLSSIISLLVVMAITAVNVACATPKGTKANPYQVSTKEQLEAIQFNFMSHYILVNDIDLSGYTYDQAVIQHFEGSFDGNGFAIRNLVINAGSKDDVGLFGYLTPNCLVKNLLLQNADITGNERVGALTGTNRGLIENCGAINASVSGAMAIGGLCGRNDNGTIKTSFTTGSVSGDLAVGGLCGNSQQGAMTNCYSDCNVSGGDFPSIGGFLGWANNTIIENCYSSAVVSSQHPNPPYGFGDIDAEFVRNCFWNKTANPSIENGIRPYPPELYSWNVITSISSVEMAYKPTFTDAGWDFVGENSNGVLGIWYMPEDGFPILFWQDEVPHFTVTFVSGENGSIVGGKPIQSVGITRSAEAPLIEPNSGWWWTGWDGDFSNITEDITLTATYEPIGNKGSGTIGDPYKIATVSDLEAVNNAQSACYMLVKDINLAGYIYYNPVVEDFNGVFNGNGFAIKNLVISNSESSDIGFFRIIWYNATVKNLLLLNANITGNQRVGAIVAANVGLIENCGAVNISVSGSTGVGGLCGFNDDGIIKHCYTSGKVVASSGNGGGLCGTNNNIITNSYSNSSVSGGSSIGGFCGTNNGKIDCCYSSGSVDGLVYIGGFCGSARGYTTGSFWNIDTSNQPTSNGATPISSVEMAYKPTFTDAGWDFIGENSNGVLDIWYMLEDGFPVLFWQDEVPHFTVTFVSGENGSIVGGKPIQSVGITRSAEAPLIEPSSGWWWTGWDGDFSNITEDITLTATYEPIGNKGSGTIGDPYKIATVSDLEAVNNAQSACYMLVKDINLSGIDYNDSIIEYFHGTFDGNGFTINNLTISSPQNSYIGLFGEINYEANIINLLLKNTNITGNERVGALAGTNRGLIENCGAINASILGSTTVGGLCGKNDNGTIKASFTTGSVSGEYEIGGLCGSIDRGLINNCYSGSNTYGYNCHNTGGFIGGGYNGVIENSYSFGEVISQDGCPSYAFGDIDGEYIFNCFWNKTANPTSEFGIRDYNPDYYPHTPITALTSAKMTYSAHFLDAGWDFVGENFNGGLDIWYMPQNGSPILAWQKEVPRFTVTFVAEYGQIVRGQAVQSVIAGTSATSPIIESHNHRWIGWDKDFSNITADTTINAVYYDGDYFEEQGTRQHPFRVYTAYDIERIYQGYYVLMRDINLSGQEYKENVIPSFNGEFNGNGFKLFGLNITQQPEPYGTPLYYGLIGRLEQDGVIRNLGFVNSSISPEYIIDNTRIGTIAGYNYGEITNCYVENGFAKGGSPYYPNTNIYSHPVTGGMCGMNIGHISQSYYNGKVVGYVYVGGLCGANIGSYTYDGVGGKITASYSAGTVMGRERVGGFCGYNSGFIADSYTTCDIYGNSYSRSVGGFCGYLNTIPNPSVGYLVNCYSSGRWLNADFYCSDSDCRNDFFGFSGAGYPFNLHPPVSNCFWDTTQCSEFYDGYSESLPWEGIPFHDPQEYPNVVTGLDGVEMRAKGIFSDAGWNFVGDTGNPALDVWYMPQNGSPILAWQKEAPRFTVTFNPGNNGFIKSGESIQYVVSGAAATSPIVEPKYGYLWTGWDKNFSRITEDTQVNAVYININDRGDGTEQNPYRIFTPADLEAINGEPTAHYELMNDIELGGLVHSDFVVNEFYGTLNGNNFEIKNLTINNFKSANTVGLFGKINSQATVKNLRITGISLKIYIASGYIGGLAGINEGLITGCYCEGSIDSWMQNKSSLMCGENYGIIEKSYTEGFIETPSMAGGICCDNYGTIRNCYTTVSILNLTSSASSGGLCRVNSAGGIILNCYSAGYCVENDTEPAAFCRTNNGLIKGSFWNTQTYSGFNGIVNGLGDLAGISNAYMAYKGTFIDAGWDLAGRLADGFEEIWVVAGGNFPVFSGLPPVTFNTGDFFNMAEQWLTAGNYDIYPDGGDGIVDLKDFAWLAFGWTAD